jgi:hypothetical protein
VPRQVICISFADGSGGEHVGPAVAGRLGIPCLDEEIVAAAAERIGAEPETLASVERRHSLLNRILEHFETVAQGEPVAPPEALVTSGELRQRINEAVVEAADRGPAVIVSHAGSIALAGRPDVLRVLVTASPAVRAARVAAERGLDARAAGREVHDADERRAHYLRRHHGVDREEPTHYDLVVSTDVFGPEAATELVLAAAALPAAGA